MKIGHISDLHLNTAFKKNNFESVKLLISTVINRGIDHLCITGDLTDNADEEDFYLLRSFLKDVGHLNGNKTSLVAGNHDIFGGLVKPEDIFDFKSKYRRVDYRRKFDEFYGYFADTFENCVYKSKENHFPFLKIINDTLIIGINSIPEYSSVKNPFASNGLVTLSQIKEIEEKLKDLKGLYNKSVALIHHHFNKIRISKINTISNMWQRVEKQTLKLYKKKRLFNLFNDSGINLVLHGHYHEMNDYVRKDIRFINSGGSIKNYKKMGQLSAYLIDIAEDDVKTTLITLNPEGIRKNIPVTGYPAIESIYKPAGTVFNYSSSPSII